MAEEISSSPQEKSVPTVAGVEDSDRSDALSINEIALGDKSVKPLWRTRLCQVQLTVSNLLPTQYSLPPGYYTSLPFIGTILGLTLGVISSYIIFVMTTNVLSFTNMDIGQ